MKKLCLLLVTVLTMVLFIGTTKAASFTYNLDEKAKVGTENKHKYGYVQTTATYEEGSVIKIYTAAYNGVDHYTAESIASNEYFDVTVDSNDAAMISRAEANATKKGVTYYDIRTYTITLKKDLPAGKYDLLDIKVWHKSGYPDLDCKVVYALIMSKPQAKTCLDSVPSENKYYDNDGNTITADDYNKICLPHVCEAVTYNNETIYYDNDGNEVASEEAMKKACGCRAEESKDQTTYYNDDNEKITEEEYKFYCEPHVCAPVTFEGKTYYYNAKGEKVDTEEEMNASCKCRYDKDTDKYYDLENKETTKEEYEKMCLCRTEDGKDGKIYYCKQGEVCDATEFENQCPKDVKTGSNIPYIAIIGGAVLAGSTLIVAKKRSKLKNI